MTDIPVMQTLRNDLAVQTDLMSLARPNSTYQVQTWLQQKSSTSDGLFFVVADSETNLALGFIEVRNIHTVHGTGDFGIGLASESTGKGISVIAVGLMEQHCHQVFGIRKLTAESLLHNQPSQRMLERCGYRQVGIRERHFFHNHQYHDVIVWEHFLQQRECAT